MTDVNKAVVESAVLSHNVVDVDASIFSPPQSDVVVQVDISFFVKAVVLVPDREPLVSQSF